MSERQRDRLRHSQDRQTDTDSQRAKERREEAETRGPESDDSS